MEVDPTRMCELLVGLPAVNVLGVDDERTDVVVVHIESRASRPGCPSCGTPAWVKGPAAGPTGRSAVLRPAVPAGVAQASVVPLRPKSPVTVSGMGYAADPRVDAYIEGLPGWQQAVCRQVRGLVHATDPEVTETIKFTNRPYFVLQGNICALLAAKDHVNVFLYDGAIVPDPEGIITGGHNNQTARTIAVYEGQPLNAPAFSTMISQIIANNRAGGWRQIKRDREEGRS